MLVLAVVNNVGAVLCVVGADTTASGFLLFTVISLTSDLGTPNVKLGTLGTLGVAETEAIGFCFSVDTAVLAVFSLFGTPKEKHGFFSGFSES